MKATRFFGAAKINAILRNRGYVVAEKTVADIMHENGWFSIHGGSKKLYEMNKQRKYIISAICSYRTEPGLG